MNGRVVQTPPLQLGMAYAHMMAQAPQQHGRSPSPVLAFTLDAMVLILNPRMDWLIDDPSEPMCSSPSAA